VYVSEVVEFKTNTRSTASDTARQISQLTSEAWDTPTVVQARVNINRNHRNMIDLSIGEEGQIGSEERPDDEESMPPRDHKTRNPEC
jgi:hypothetical protein